MCLIFPPHLTSAPALPGEVQKLHLFSQMLYYCSARLQPAASL